MASLRAQLDAPPPAADAWPAPAKLNLLLRITGRRADGYHELQTVFQFLDKGDWLRFIPRTDGRITRRGQVPGVPPEADLTVRAAEALAALAPRCQGVTIELHKRLPLGGGLGGGSSDAATVLVVLNRLWQVGLDTHALAAVGLTLGADVPVFVRGRAAWGEGVGERLTPLDDLARPWYLVLAPAVAVSTKAVFQDPQLPRHSPSLDPAAFRRGVRGNDCEAVVYRQYPAIAAAARWLENFAPARLTGTGCCVFAPFEDPLAAAAALAQKPQGLEGFIARGENRSPLHRRLEEVII
ncbi:MAG: 4-(cytidine 5'-diphospho)-2-C-methyl-D-erythritol kinase [Candidatus Competibacterales bacterium]